MAAITAKQRVTYRLAGTTALLPPDALDVVREVTRGSLGGGKSILTTGITNLGANVSVTGQRDGVLSLRLTSGKQLVELCTFSATATRRPDGRTDIRVGGLQTYKTKQEKLLSLIPIGPKLVVGMDAYKRLLTAVAETLRSMDTTAQVETAVPQT